MQTDITKTSTTNLAGIVTDYSVDTQSTDGSSEFSESIYNNPNFSQNHGYYRKIPELKKAIDAYATWVLGKGFVADDAETEVILDNIIGWGEDTIQSILWNMLVIKKINGDAYSEIIRDTDTGELINLKPLTPEKVTIVVNDKGVIDRYEYKSGKVKQKYKPHEIFHLCNDRVADEIHGVSVIEACQWVIDARNEAMTDWRRISHRSTIRVMYVDEDDKDRLSQLKQDYADGINNGEVLILPGKPADIQFQDLTLPPYDAFIGWIRYLENFFYQAVGIPKVILGGSEEFTEASSKISYLTYEQIYTREVVDLEKDIWNQLGLKIKFNKPASLRSEMLSSEEKNTGQIGFQPNDTTAGVGK